jgi:hypothetical protein
MLEDSNKRILSIQGEYAKAAAENERLEYRIRVLRESSLKRDENMYNMQLEFEHKNAEYSQAKIQIQDLLAKIDTIEKRDALDTFIPMPWLNF